MIKARLAKWEYIKNAKREDWGYLAVLHEIRRKENKPTAFLIRGHRKTVKDLQRFIRNQNISPDKFLAESFDNFRAKGAQFPDYIRASTPDPEDIIHSPSADTSLSEIRSPSPLVAHRRPSRVSLHERKAYASTSPDENSTASGSAQSESDYFEHKCPYKCYATEPNHFCITRDTMTNMPSTSSNSGQSQEHLQFYSFEQRRLELEACSHQLLKPMPLTSKFGHNDMRCWMMIHHRKSTPPTDDKADITEEKVCTGCNQSGSIHFPSLDLFEPQQRQRNILNDTTGQTLQVPTSTRDEGSWVWVSLCFLACMSLTRGDEDVAQMVLAQAESKFEALLLVQDRLLLTAAHLMIAILHMHDQQDISTRILQSARTVVERVLPEDDPIRLTICYLALTANSSLSKRLLKEAQCSGDRMGTVYHQLEAKYGKGHPYAIAAHHNYAWMLKYENKKALAEQHARQTCEDSTACFGRLHMQTITSRSVVAGCLAGEKGKERECAEMYRMMINDATQILGVIHPYTLEAQRRLADCLERIPGGMDTALKIHKTILFGRAAMLGKNHSFTLGQKDYYIEMLKRLDKWQDKDGQQSTEQKELTRLNAKHPEEAWEVVSNPSSIRPRSRGEDEDFEMIDAPGPSRSTTGRRPDEAWCHEAMTVILSRSASPKSDDLEFESY